MIRVVHLFDVKKGVNETQFIEWLDAALDRATQQFGCQERKTWQILEGFTGTYQYPTEIRDRPRYVNEAYWQDLDGPRQFRDWLLKTHEGREMHDRWFGSIENHTVLRYTAGWGARIQPDE